jgi:hypothetical protein
VIRLSRALGDSHAMSPLQIHPVVAQFAPVDGALLATLIRDIRSNGQHLPIVLYEGMVFDGRARLSACVHLGIKPWLVPLRRKDPMEFYILSNYERCGEPRSPERNAAIAALSNAGSSDGRAEARKRRSEWIRAARAEFKDLVGRREVCAVCRKHIDFVHAHHSFPFSLQFECGVDAPIHDHQWLCPVHHKYVHVLLSGYLLGSRDLCFLEGIPDNAVEEWTAIEKSARKGIDLCCEALGRVPGENRPRRYDPPYGLFLINNPSLAPAAVEWNRSVRPLQRPSGADQMAARAGSAPTPFEPASTS